MRNLSLLYSISLTLILLGSCDAPSEKGTPIPYENIEEAASFNVPTVGTEVIQDSARWINMWEY